MKHVHVSHMPKTDACFMAARTCRLDLCGPRGHSGLQVKLARFKLDTVSPKYTICSQRLECMHDYVLLEKSLLTSHQGIFRLGLHRA